MKPLKPHEIRGNWATLLLAWNDDDKLDLGRIDSVLDALIEMQVDGIYSNGTAGEFHAQTEAEFDRVSQLLAEKCNAANMPFQIGVSHMSAQISLGRLRRAVELRPGAVQVILPDWVPISEIEANMFLQRMAEAAEGIGLVLYNPRYAKSFLNPEQIGHLSKQVSSLVGLKSIGGDNNWYASIASHLPLMSVFVPGHLLASGVQHGAHGAYSNVACLNPLAAQRWTDQMKTDLPAALELERRLGKFLDSYIFPFIRRDAYCDAACDRLLALIGGWAEVGQKVRWPYRSIPADAAERLRPIAKEILPEFIS